MDAASTSPILSTAQSMANFIPMGSRAGWSRSTPSQRAGTNLTKTSSCRGPRATYRTRYVYKAGTHPRIPIVTHEIEGAQRSKLDPNNGGCRCRIQICLECLLLALSGHANRADECPL